MTREELKRAESNAFDLYYAAALQGLCSNPNDKVVELDAINLSATAYSIATDAIEVRRDEMKDRDDWYDEFPKGYQE